MEGQRILSHGMVGCGLVGTRPSRRLALGPADYICLYGFFVTAVGRAGGSVGAKCGLGGLGEGEGPRPLASGTKAPSGGA